MKDNRPWSSVPVLASQLARWRRRLAGRNLFRVTAGPDWVRVGLEGDAHPAIFLTCLPGASLIFSLEGPLPGPVFAALPPTRNHPLARLLEAAEFSSCGMIPDDRVAALRLKRPDGNHVYLIHQLFGARGNTVLLDDQAKLLWAHRRPPHSLLTAIPPEEVWSHGETDASSQEVSEPALEFLAAHLLQISFRQTRTPLERQLKSGRRLVENLARDFDQADKGDLYRRKAEALAAHLHGLSQGSESVEVTDPRDGNPLTIELDPALTPAANMDAWFRRARKADKGHQIIAERLAAAREAASSVTEALAEVEEIAAGGEPDLDRLALLQAWRTDHPDLVGEKQRKAAGSRYGPEEPARPFRRYRVDGRWEVWVGRNNKENDQLTHRAAHSRDIWLHAQGVPGSHVILRTAGKPEQVPRSVLEKAAALAALNSKARHSELVPVIHTQQRYVRKPRKSPPGTAVCLREKSLFVAPIVAPGVVSI